MVGNAVQYVVIDAFTENPFKGNPAAVCLLDEEKTHDWMRLVALEFNIANTSFLTPLPLPSLGPNPRFGLKWFTLGIEVKICGHGTVAAAHFLFTSGFATTGTIEFVTKSGLLTAKRVNKSKQPGILASTNSNAGGKIWIELDFPSILLIDCNPVWSSHQGRLWQNYSHSLMSCENVPEEGLL